jgi:hypothetical protein
VTGEFRPREILRVLEDYSVEYVLIGGFAAMLHGSAHVTLDVDITPNRALRNLSRLSDALRALDARIRVEGEPGGLPFRHDAQSLGEVQVLNLITRAGALDISFMPSGTQGYTDLAKDAKLLDLDGLHIYVASLADVVRSKEAAGRPKDHLTLPTLRRLLEDPHVARAELLAGGDVLLTLQSVEGGILKLTGLTEDLTVRRGTQRSIPMVVQCRVSDPRFPGRTWTVRSRAEVPDLPDRIQVRYPTDFPPEVAGPLPSGAYQVSWVQQVFRRNQEQPRLRELARVVFEITSEGRFLAG